MGFILLEKIIPQNPMENKILKEVRFLKIYSAILTLLIISFLTWSFISKQEKKHFEEIDVERINIVEDNGDLKMVISNHERQHPGMMSGKIIKERERPPGIIFFNEEQDEVGGLIYSGNSEDGAGMVLSIDQYKADQVVQLRYIEKKGKRKYGLQLWDRDPDIGLPQLLNSVDSLRALGLKKSKIIEKLREMNDGKPISAERLFLGKNIKEQVGLFVQDEFGNDRIRIYVDENNTPRMEFLDEKGNAVPIGEL